MLRSVSLLFICTLCFAACTDEPEEINCSTPATIRDLTGLDGCGFVFELEDGTRLEPVSSFHCGNEDPVYNFTFIDGKKVLISYEPAQAASICMAGETVKITCIQEIISQQH